MNKNMVPFDDKSPMVTSGIRIGTPAITTRGLTEKEMGVIVQLIDEALENRTDISAMERIKGKVKEMMGVYPLFNSTEAVK